MTVQSHTHWHKIFEAIDNKQVYFTGPTNTPSIKDPSSWVRPYDVMGANLANVRALFECWSALPKFTVAPELVALSREDDMCRSLLDLKKADTLHLPYPAMIVEFPKTPRGVSIVFVRDILADPKPMPWETQGQFPSTRAPFYGIASYIEKDEHGEYLVIAPSTSSIDIVEDRNSGVHLSVGVIGLSVLPHSPEAIDLCKNTYMKDSATVWKALFIGLLILGTGGVQKKEVSDGELKKLNKQRQARGRVQIPAHTHIYIGRVYRSASSEASDAYVPGKSPRPHWRRAHLRGVRYGAGREKIKQVLIPGKLVAWHGQGPVPEKPTYVIKNTCDLKVREFE